MTPFYADDTTTLYCADMRNPELADELEGQAAAVVTSPPYNVGLEYADCSDTLDWPAYWSLTAGAAALVRRALVPGGRAWVNTAVSVPVSATGSGKARVMLAHRWATALVLPRGSRSRVGHATRGSAA